MFAAYSVAKKHESRIMWLWINGEIQLKKKTFDEIHDPLGTTLI